MFDRMQAAFARAEVLSASGSRHDPTVTRTGLLVIDPLELCWHRRIAGVACLESLTEDVVEPCPVHPRGPIDRKLTLGHDNDSGTDSSQVAHRVNKVEAGLRRVTPQCSEPHPAFECDFLAVDLYAVFHVQGDPGAFVLQAIPEANLLRP
jgi:hypothetical protein